MIFKKFTLITLAFFLLNSVGIKSSIIDYIVAGLYIFSSLIFLNKFKFQRSTEFYFPIVMILVWIYGFVIAITNNTDLYNIIFNFPGILLMVLFYPINSIKLSYKNIFHLFVYSALAINIYVIIGILFRGNLELVLSDLILNRQYYSVSLILQVISFNFILLSKENLRTICVSNKLYIITRINSLLSMIVLLISFSKGFWLSSFASFFLIIFISFLNKLKNRKVHIKYSLILFSLPLIPIFFYFYIPDFTDAILAFFSSDAVGNTIRNEQAKYLYNEFSYFGSGLGTPLKSGYIRDQYGYAFELSFYNVIHKFGILMSIILLYPYFYSIVFFIRKLFYRGAQFQSIFSISALSFLIAASGNPLLFASLNMLIFTIVLILINHEKNDV